MDSVNLQHAELASGRWQKMPLSLQLGNIGSEVSRAVKWHNKGNFARFESSFDRALELFDLSIASARGPKLKELCRAREEFCDYFNSNSFLTDPDNMVRYYDQFASLSIK